MRLKFIIVILVQILLLTGIIAYRQHWVDTGARILLRTEPVDPRSLFRGDYVTLSYEITNLDLDRLSSKEDFKRKEKVYVTLAKNDDGTYRAASISKTQPSGKRFIQGRVKRFSTHTTRCEVKLRDTFGNVHYLEPRWFSKGNKGERMTFCLDDTGRVIRNYMTDDPIQQEYGCKMGTPIAGTVEEVKEIKFRQLTVEYGIESYFVEEGKGRSIEKARNARDLIVEVSLNKDGKGIITALYMDGKMVR